MSATLRKSPRRWTDEEDLILYREAKKQSPNTVWDWNRIAANFTDRSNKDCRKRWINRVSGGLKKGLWSEEEDAKLCQAVETLGSRWTLVAEAVGCRSADQCAKRWQHHLDPHLDRREWTDVEDDELLRAVQKHGRTWKAIRDQHFSSRSRNDVKNRYTILIRRGSSLRSASTAKPHVPEIESDEDENEDAEDGEDDGDEDDDEDDKDDDLMHVSISESDDAPGGTDQHAMNLDDYLTPFTPFEFGAEAATIFPPERPHFLLSPLSDAMPLDSSIYFPFEPVTDTVDFIATAQISPNITDELWSCPSAGVATAPASDNSVLSQLLPSPKLSTYKRVTLELEDCEKGLMDQLLQVVSMSQGKSRIEVLP